MKCLIILFFLTYTVRSHAEDRSMLSSKEDKKLLINNFTGTLNQEFFYYLPVTGINTLELRDSVIEIVEDDVLCYVSFKNLRLLDNRKFPNLTKNYFGQCDALQELFLSKNEMFIETDAFDTLGNLRKLTIFDQEIKEICRQQFANLKELKILILVNCGTKTIHRNSLTNLQNLEELIIAGNEISEIDGVFENLQKLNFLSLSSNQIFVFPWNDLVELDNLQLLNINDNKISNFDTNILKNHVSNLKSLDITRNQIDCDKVEEIGKELLKKRKNLVFSGDLCSGESRKTLDDNYVIFSMSLYTMHTCKNCGYQSYWNFAFNHHRKHCQVPLNLAHITLHCWDTLNPYRCLDCTFETNLRIRLLKHFQCNHQTIFQLFGIEEYLKHIRNDNVDENIQESHCEVCGFQTFSNFCLLTHMERAHSSQQSSTLKCIHCTYQPKSKSGLKQHLLYKHTEKDKIKWFECRQCPYKARQAFALQKHITNKHLSFEEIKWFECELCGFKTKQSSHLQVHMLRKHSESGNGYECDQCPYKTSVKYDLREHKQRRHNNDNKWFECSLCPYKAKVKNYLIRHVIRKHAISEDIKWFECSYCPYRAKLKNNLHKHVVRRHTSPEEVKWFECGQCPFRTRREYYLRKHLTCKHS